MYTYTILTKQKIEKSKAYQRFGDGDEGDCEEEREEESASEVHFAV